MPYPTILQGRHSQPNPTHIEYTTIVVENFYTTIVRYPTLNDFLAIAPEEISHWNYYLTYPNKCVKPKLFQPSLLPPPLYTGEMLHHMPDAGESLDVSVCHTVNLTSPSICQ